jgi:hypothetical protein
MVGQLMKLKRGSVGASFVHYKHLCAVYAARLRAINENARGNGDGVCRIMCSGDLFGSIGSVERVIESHRIFQLFGTQVAGRP